MIEENVKNLFNEIPKANPLGESVTLVAAVKTRTPEEINRAVECGIRDIGDNHVQEFKDKYDQIIGNPRRHFIGHLQTNKVKYLVGKVDLYHSLDRWDLCEELDKRSQKAGVISPVLIQINIGKEDTKSGFLYEELDEAYEKISAMQGLKIKGLMAMLPESDDISLLTALASRMREGYDKLKKNDDNIEYLSMGMSGDWRICVNCGSNMIRLGTAIFGARDYNR